MTEAGIPVYLDANVFIFALEGDPLFGAASATVLRAVEAGTIAAVTSELTLAEVLVKPLKLGRGDLVDRFLAAIGEGPIAVHPLSRAILLRSAEIRAVHGGRLADALHVATAIEAGCEPFVSEDRGIRPPPGLSLVPVADVGAPKVPHP